MNITVLKFILGAAAAGYFLSALFYIRKKNTAAFIANGAGWILNAAAVGVNWFNNGYVPFVSMYQVLTFLGLCFTLIYIYVYFVDKSGWMAPYFAVLSGFVMTGACFMNPTIVWRLAPALQSVWFIPHILAYMLSYSLCSVASVLSAVWFFNKKLRDKLEHGIYYLIIIAFPFMTVGILFGAIWANEVWGDFWSWDVKENWALITWMCYAIYLHCRLYKPLKKAMNVFVIVGFAALLMTFLGVGFFGADSPHSYA